MALDKVNEKSFLNFISEYLVDIGCNAKQVKDFINSNTFSQAIILPLAIVCLMPENKPKESKSKQTHIHVTSTSRYFFYSKDVISTTNKSTEWVKQDLVVSKTNIKALLNNEKSSNNNLDLSNSHMMKKIECRKNQENQVQLSTLSSDDKLFLDLRRGLKQENDLLIFLRYKDKSNNSFFTLGIPKSYYENKYYFDNNSKNNKIKPTIYNIANIDSSVTIKKALNEAIQEFDNDDVITKEEPISETLYQIMVTNANPTITDYKKEKYIDSNPSGKNTISYRPTTNPGIGKEAIINNNYCCSVDSNHTTFLKPDKTIYMEVHHLIPLQYQKDFENKLDTKANIVPLSPNCHRMLHYGCEEDKFPILKKLYQERKSILEQSGLFISEDDLISYYK